MLGNFYIPGHTRRALASAVAALAQADFYSGCAECIEAALPDLTLIGLDQAADLRRLVYGVAA